jgi:phosphoglycolate phosphatase-like HAD superfamily hydrolase
MSEKIVLIDYDGVIVDSFESLFNVYKIASEELNFDFPDDVEEFRNMYDYNFKSLQKKLGLSNEDSDKLNAIYSREIVNQETKIFEGIKEVLESLSNKYKFYLLSAAFIDEINLKLEKNDLKKYFLDLYGDLGTSSGKRTQFERFFKDKNYLPNEIIYIGDRNMDYDICQEFGVEEVYIVDYGWGYDKNKIPNKNYEIKIPKDILKYV